MIKIVMTVLMLMGFSTLSLELKAQTQKEDTTVYRLVDTKAEFPGGDERMQEYIDFRLNGEQSGVYDLKEGEISVEFIVEKNGRIKQITIVKGLDPLFDENFANIFKGMPKWKPAQKNGLSVRSLLKYSWGMNYYMNK